MAYLAHEVELSKRHEEILGLRTTLLQQMENQLESQTNEKKLQAVEFESANERNMSLLKDLEIAEEKLRAGAHTHLHPNILTLEHLYLLTAICEMTRRDAREQIARKASCLLMVCEAEQRELEKMKYWASVEEHLPKWEQFLLGQTKSPVEVTNPRHKKPQKEEPQEKVTIKSSILPSSASTSKTPTQSPHSEKQNRTKVYKKRIM